MKFTESQLEQAFIELLGKEEIPHLFGQAIQRSLEEVLIKKDLKDFLLNQYKAEEITESEVESIIRDLERLPASDLYDSNKAFMKLVCDGFLLKREDRSKKDLYIQLINYSDIGSYNQPKDQFLNTIVAEKAEQYPQDSNIYKFVNQLEIIGYEKRIPDGILYINGLPLVVF